MNGLALLERYNCSIDTLLCILGTFQHDFYANFIELRVVPDYIETCSTSCTYGPSELKSI